MAPNLSRVTCGLVGHLISGQNSRLNQDLSKCLILGNAGLIVPSGIVAPVRFAREIAIQLANHLTIRDYS